ncbi:MAG: hypothetical protein KF799_10925 [Bdellovibrionales bacterium]|nr:hypothetical protein [Bdellovibrionales bacterium]
MHPKNSSSQTILRGQRGQIVVEYVLLLVIGVSVAALITSSMVSRSENNPGFLVKKWFEIIKLIGEDTADDLKSQQNQ